MIDPGLLFGQLPLCQFGGAVEEGPQLLLLQLAVFPVLQPCVGGEVVGGGEEGVTDLVDDVLAGGLERGHQLGFYLAEIVVHCLLEHAALGFTALLRANFRSRTRTSSSVRWEWYFLRQSSQAPTSFDWQLSRNLEFVVDCHLVLPILLESPIVPIPPVLSSPLATASPLP